MVRSIDVCYICKHLLNFKAAFYSLTLCVINTDDSQSHYDFQHRGVDFPYEVKFCPECWMKMAGVEKLFEVADVDLDGDVYSHPEME